MKIVLSHPTGNQFVRALILALSEADMLSDFYTTIAANPNANWLNILPASLKQEWLRRSYPIPQNQIRSYPLLELARTLSPRLGLKSVVKHETGWASVDAVYRDLDKKVASAIMDLSSENRPDSVYAYEDGAAYTFNAAKQQHIKCLYDLPIGYWRAARELLGAERERWPDWAVTLTGFEDSDAKLQRKDEEIRLADRIFVASGFTADTLKYYKGELPPVKIIPYAFPEVAKIRHYADITARRPLKLLFVGGLSQRKGIADVFEAVKHFGNKVQLTVVGRKVTANCRVLDEELAKHRWIPSMPHEDVLKLMREHDVLVFPSQFEGFGLVITEAMAQGTPVITTERTAGPDIINNGENGWLINAGSTQKLQDAIEYILQHPQQIELNGRAAMETAKKRTWQVYGQELLNAIIDTK
ncbi:glycosyltransferase family 4 protein [Mucilaginibacter segetis]|uniref:Glycosyltransferase family 4 protein n=1 Tax=Mucilaginibacter segetis TaxID=2793071 RepID=A0A934UP65_9SPHI|nr:glycosyltransferase family 4 protein [Mucilaginibacter segetis]MBK0380662.1 glycosyltransferase family 4 protein [Mucilaginibacter segetis]